MEAQADLNRTRDLELMKSSDKALKPESIGRGMSRGDFVSVLGVSKLKKSSTQRDLPKIGHSVIVAGRRQVQLDKAKLEVPQLHIVQGDVSNDASRIALFEKVSKDFPLVNVLINNAGYGAPPSLYKDMDDASWQVHKNVIATNLEGPIHLSTLFLKHFLALNVPSAIINVSSLSVFIPFAPYATYAATKAALHSFTISLRHQLKDSLVKVVEILPPIVDT
eukprot:gene32851-40551_t